MLYNAWAEYMALLTMKSLVELINEFNFYSYLKITMIIILWSEIIKMNEFSLSIAKTVF